MTVKQRLKNVEGTVKWDKPSEGVSVADLKTARRDYVPESGFNHQSPVDCYLLFPLSLERPLPRHCTN